MLPLETKQLEEKREELSYYTNQCWEEIRRVGKDNGKLIRDHFREMSQVQCSYINQVSHYSTYAYRIMLCGQTSYHTLQNKLPKKWTEKVQVSCRTHNRKKSRIISMTLMYLEMVVAEAQARIRYRQKNYLTQKRMNND